MTASRTAELITPLGRKGLVRASFTTFTTSGNLLEKRFARAVSNSLASSIALFKYLSIGFSYVSQTSNSAKRRRMGMELARDLRERALAAETPEEATRLAKAFHTVSRGVRQSLALELRVIRFRNDLHREVQAAEAKAAEAAGAAAAVREPAVARRREEIGSQVERLIYTEYEGYEDAPYEDPRANRLQWRLSDWMAAASARDDFTTADLDGQIIAACEQLGLDPARLSALDGDGEGDEDDEPDDDDDGESAAQRQPVGADSS
jgi:hypothetical protein